MEALQQTPSPRCLGALGACSYLEWIDRHHEVPSPYLAFHELIRKNHRTGAFGAYPTNV